jgi:hypothetical protein
MVLTQHTVRIEQDARNETVAIFPRHDLTAVEVTGEDEVVAAGDEALPASRVVRAHDTDIARVGGRGVRTRDRDRALAVGDVGRPVMDPSAAGSLHHTRDEVHPDPSIVVAADGQDRRPRAERRHQVAQVSQLGRRVDQVAAEEYRLRMAEGGGVQDLTAQRVGTPRPEMDVADMEQPTGIGGRRKTLLADVKRASKSKLQRA